MMARRTWLVMEYRSFTQTTPTAFDLGRLDSKTSALGLASGGLHTSAGELKIEQFHRKHLWRGIEEELVWISTTTIIFFYQNMFFILNITRIPKDAFKCFLGFFLQKYRLMEVGMTWFTILFKKVKIPNSFFFNKINGCMRRSILRGTKLDSHTSYFKRGTFPQYSVPNKCELMMAWPCTINQLCGDDIHKLLWWALIRQNWHLPKDTSCGPKVRRAVHYKILLGTWRNSYVWDGQLYR